MKALLYTAFLIVTAIMPLAAAEASATTPSTQTSTAEQKRTAAEKNRQTDKTALPAEYRSVKLGMHIDAVKEALKADAVFRYRGERDVSLLPTENRSLIESAGSYFISRSWFQFYKDNLYTMIFKLNTDTVDY